MLKFKNKVEHVTATNKIDNYSITYSFQMNENGLVGNINANASSIDGRQAINMSSYDGVTFHTNTSENINDDLTVLHAGIKSDIIEIYTNTSLYISEAEV